jgi:2'-5' RNA ligase
VARPNYFFAFPVDGAFVLDLPLPPSFRLFHPEDVHMTLSFLGGCGEEAALRALAALDSARAQRAFPSLHVSLGSVVPMGSARAYSALSALLEQGRAEATECLAAWRDVISDAALGRREKRAPKPHITIARPRIRVTDAGREAGLAWAKSLDLSGIRATLTRVALYTWSEGNRRERLFRVIAERSLDAASDAVS